MIYTYIYLILYYHLKVYKYTYSTYKSCLLLMHRFLRNIESKFNFNFSNRYKNVHEICQRWKNLLQLIILFGQFVVHTLTLAIKQCSVKQKYAAGN